MPRTIGTLLETLKERRDWEYLFRPGWRWFFHEMVDALCLSVSSVVAAPIFLLFQRISRCRKYRPAAGGGETVKQVHPDWMQTEVYHLLYLPKDWQPGKRYPVIVEYAGNGPYQNRFGDISTGHPEGSKMGWHYWRPRFYLGMHSISQYRR